MLGYILSPAQQLSLKFSHFGKQDGLSQSSVNYIFQDHQDFVWVATFGGINRFDGYQFPAYTHEFGDNTSISDNAVWTIYECRDSSLWFGTKRGLSILHRETGLFTNYFIRSDHKSTNTLSVKSLFEDSRGDFYVGSEGDGLFRFLKAENRFEPVEVIPDSAKISAITEDAEGNLWVGTEDQGLFQVASDRESAIHFLAEGKLNVENIWSLCNDKKGNTWIGTDKDGLIRYQKKDGRFTFYSKHEDTHRYDAGSKIKTLTLDEGGMLWIGSATQGLSYYDYQADRFYAYTHSPYDANSLFDNDVSSISVGANGVLFVGFSTRGFDKIISTPFHIIRSNPSQPNSLSSNNVYCMYKDKEDIMWWGTFGGGLNRFDPKTQTFTHYRHDEGDPTSISHDWIRIIMEDSKGRMWIGTWGGGLNLFDKKTGKCKRYLPKSGSKNRLSLNIITSLFEDADGEIWIGTYGEGINIYQEETDDFRAIRHDKKNPNSLSDNHITSFYQDEAGLIWICTYGGGLSVFDKKKKDFIRILPDPEKPFSLNDHKTLHIFPEKDSSFFWLTTLGGGLNKYYFEEDRFVHYTEKDGIANNVTLGMLKDETGKYWISSNMGISLFDPQTEHFRNFHELDGLANDGHNLSGYIQDTDGTMYFGGKNGITYFDPQEITDEAVFPTVAITYVDWEDSVFSFVPSLLTVPYKSHFNVEFAAINADKTAKIKYAYQLVGLDEGWRELHHVRHLEFSNLFPGEYDLRIKSTNSKDEWNEQYTSFPIYVSRPWYMTWTFRLAIILASIMLILGLVYRYYEFRLSRSRVINKKLQRKVEKRTFQIKQKNEALEKEKDRTEKAFKQLQKLEGFKHELVNMIAHDLKNPLVTILSYSSENSPDDEIRLESIHKSGNTMLSLIENMLEIQKFENTEVKLNLGTHSVHGLISEAFLQVQVLLDEKRIKLINHIDPKLSVSVDGEIFERVLTNLLTNAIKFSLRDSVIEIFEKRNDRQSNRLVLGIQDHGSGIPQHLLGTIFDKFSQVEARDSGNIQSNGLGLTFCRMAMEAHGGKIWAESIPDEGSTFFLEIERSNETHTQTLGKDPNTEIPGKGFFDFSFAEKDQRLLSKFSDSISNLTIYETGAWLSLFDEIKKDETELIQKWRQMMLDALTTFDETAFAYLQAMACKNSEVETNN